MFRRILVPLDGSSEGEDILPEAVRIAAADAEFFLLHVVPIYRPPQDARVNELLRVPEQAFDYLEGVGARLGRRRLRTLVRQGDPAEEIAQAALELGAELVAMTTHGRSGLRRVLVGSVAEATLRRSATPVLLGRPGVPRPGTELRGILVPLDGSARSHRILELVRPLALERGSRVRLLEVVVPVVVGVPPAGITTTAPASLRDPTPRLLELARPLEEAGIRVEVRAAWGYAAPEILRAARDAGADLIAMATSGRKGLSRFILGSVAEEVVRETDRPLLLLRVPEPDEGRR